ncbi:hypothetical protein BSKO_07066 [Bryopsis sp. KO-2023]|nr:hypothetical protein BSKO_07066 [Bryopsis sp. KO-2023]
MSATRTFPTDVVVLTLLLCLVSTQRGQEGSGVEVAVKCGIVCQDECHERWLLAANIPDWQAWGKWEFMDDESLDRLVKLLTIFEKHSFKLYPVTFANDPLSRSNFSFLFTEHT